MQSCRIIQQKLLEKWTEERVPSGLIASVSGFLLYIVERVCSCKIFFSLVS